MGTLFQSIASHHPGPDFTGQSTEIIAGVEFGTPTRDGHCVNIGICRVTTDMALLQRKLSNRRCRFARALIRCGSDRILHFYFAADQMLPCTERAIFTSGYFPVPSDYHLPASVCALLPAGAPDHIKAGKYRIRRTAGGYWVSFMH